MSGSRRRRDRRTFAEAINTTLHHLLEQFSYQSQRLYSFEASLAALAASASKCQADGQYHIQESVRYIEVPQVKYIEIPEMHVIEVPSFCHNRTRNQEVSHVRFADRNVGDPKEHPEYTPSAWEPLVQRFLISRQQQVASDTKAKRKNYRAEERIEYATRFDSWTPLTSPVVGDVVRVDKIFISADETVQISFPVGSLGVIDFLDEDGDLQINFPSLGGVKCTIRWLLKKNIKSLMVSQRQATPKSELSQVQASECKEETTMPIL